jgi:hypothetical protein
MRPVARVIPLATALGTAALLVVLSPAQAADSHTRPLTSAQARAALLTPNQAAEAAWHHGGTYDSMDAYPVCSSVPSGFLCARTFDTKDTRTPFPTMVALHVTQSPAAAREELAREAAYIKESDPRTTVLALTPTSMTTVTRGLTAGGVSQTPVLESDVVRIVGSTLVEGSCGQKKSVAVEAKVVGCARDVQKAQERGLSIPA